MFSHKCHLPGGGEYDGEEGDGCDVLDDALGEGVGLVHGLAVVERVVDGDEALEADGDGHEDGGHEGDLVERVQEVREQDDVQAGREGKEECLSDFVPWGKDQIQRYAVTVTLEVK